MTGQPPLRPTSPPGWFSLLFPARRCSIHLTPLFSSSDQSSPLECRWGEEGGSPSLSSYDLCAPLSPKFLRSLHLLILCHILMPPLFSVNTEIEDLASEARHVVGLFKEKWSRRTLVVLFFFSQCSCTFEANDVSLRTAVPRCFTTCDCDFKEGKDHRLRRDVFRERLSKYS